MKKKYGECEIYKTVPEKRRRGTYYYTDRCGNVMFSILDELFYHKKECPKCGRTLYIKGSEEANKIREVGNYAK